MILFCTLVLLYTYTRLINTLLLANGYHYDWYRYAR